MYLFLYSSINQCKFLGISLEGFDVFVDKLVELYREIPNDDVNESSENEVENAVEDEGEGEGEDGVEEEGQL
jgi:hypothetical protein